MKGPEYSLRDGDLMDSFLGRSLKNWAASSQPSSNGRERLLAVAGGAQSPKQRRSTSDILRGIFLTSNYRGFHEDIRLRPLSQSVIWSFQIVASNRLLA